MKRFVLLLIAVVCLVALTAPPVHSQSESSTALTCRITKTAKKHVSAVFRTTLIRVVMTVHWCHNNTRVTRAHVTCQITDLDPVTIDPDDCQAQGHPVGWRNQPDGGFYAAVSVQYDNCAIGFGFCAHRVLNLERYYYADGGYGAGPR
jgi:hypothetical protein